MSKTHAELFPRPEKFRPIESVVNDRIYLIPIDVPNAADYIYVDTKDPKSRGFGGTTLTFNLWDGNVMEIKGPWHTNSTAMYKETGVDIQHLHFTQLALYEAIPEIKTINSVPWPVRAKGAVMYSEGVPALGDFKRPNVLAQQFANLHTEPLWVVIDSAGGGQSYVVEPQEITTVPHSGKVGRRVIDLSAAQDSVIRG